MSSIVRPTPSPISVSTIKSSATTKGFQQIHTVATHTGQRWYPISRGWERNGRNGKEAKNFHRVHILYDVAKITRIYLQPNNNESRRFRTGHEHSSNTSNISHVWTNRTENVWRYSTVDEWIISLWLSNQDAWAMKRYTS